MTQEQARYWRSLEEFDQNPEFMDDQKNEFSEQLPDVLQKATDNPETNVSRRDFLKLMGFGSAAVMTACSRVEVEKALPYVVQPEQIVPGKAYWYASTCGDCAAGCGILVKTREGRPIKIEGNPDSKVSQGGLCAVGQAGVLELYDSNRLQNPKINNKNASWGDVDQKIKSGLSSAKSAGKKTRLVTSSLTSPTIRKIIADYAKQNNDFEHITYDAVSSSAILEAHGKAFAKQVLPHFDFSKAEVVVGFGADFLGAWISPVEFTKQYTQARKIDEGNAKHKMAYHAQFETGMTVTGANADKRVAIKPSQEGVFVAVLLDEVQKLMSSPGMSGLQSVNLGEHKKTLKDLAAKLVRSKGKGLVVSGSNDVATQTLVAKLNYVLGNYGRTLSLGKESLQRQGLDGKFEQLLQDIENGQVGALILVDANPVYNFYDGDRFAKALKKVALTVSVTEHSDETAQHVQIQAPRHHFLESWGDAEPVRGFYQLLQPTLPHVYNTRSVGENLLKWFTGSSDYLAYLKNNWKSDFFLKQGKHVDFETFWKSTIKAGVFQFSATAKPVGVSSFTASASQAVAKVAGDFAKGAGQNGFEISLYESVALRDGSRAGNPWLQELPDPLTKVTWDNYLSVSVREARQKGWKTGDVAMLSVAGKKMKVPLYLQPGQAPGTASLALGYGRTKVNQVGQVGVNAYPLLDQKDKSRLSYRLGAEVTLTGETYQLAQTQTHFSMEDRPIIKETTLDKFKANPASGNEDLKPVRKLLSKEKKSLKDTNGFAMLWKAHEDKGHSWGLAIDLNSCTGCSACLIGCQSENNVAVVGKEEVAMRREMHWLRLDRYYKGENTDNPDVAFQPMLCQHCGNAPCESVCPVAATVHSSDGLNQQVYNRCVGTRYCANNCPYKVRRFNWFDYANNPRFDYNMNNTAGRLALNPDVVVRSRGVMEKCSMCVQRIQDETNTARAQNRAVQPDNIQTACQQSCPADAIVFGDFNNEKSKLAKVLKRNKSRRYNVLAELNVNPAVNYFTKIRNR